MWGWLLTLRKCFGNNREQSPQPELSEDGNPKGDPEGDLTWQQEGQVPADAVQVVIQEDGVAGSPAGRARPPSIIDASSSPQLNSAAAVPAMRASPLSKARGPAAGLVRRPSSAARSAAAQAAARGQPQSRLAVSTPAQPRLLSVEERPLAVHSTPFDVRLERQLRESDGGAAESLTANRPAAGPVWEAPVALEREHGSGAVTPASTADRIVGGKENASSSGRGKGAGGDGSVGAAQWPRLRVQVDPDRSRQLGDSGQLQTPSPGSHPLFVMTAFDGFGTPDVVGVANRHSRYREDRTLKVHETPFEERVERFIETEREWKHKRLSGGGGEATGSA